MEEKFWKLSCFIFGLIYTVDGKIIGSFYPDKNVQSAWRSNDVIQELNSGNNLLRKLRPTTADVPYKKERLSEADFTTYSLQEPEGPGTYAFGYDNVKDPDGNEHFRSEEKLRNGTVIGEYGYTDYKNKKLVRVTYVADMGGYRARTEVLPLDVFY